MPFIWEEEREAKELTEQEKDRFQTEFSLLTKRAFDFANKYDIQHHFIGIVMMGYCKMVAEYEESVRVRMVGLIPIKVEEEAKELRERIAREATLRG